MRFTTVALVLSAVVSAMAYKVTSPNENNGWSSTGPQRVAWERVATDPKNFAIMLTNQDRSVLPGDMLLKAEVDGTRSSVKVYPGRTGFPVGDGYRVNLVKSAQEPNTIYAQSSEFSIKK